MTFVSIQLRGKETITAVLFDEPATRSVPHWTPALVRTADDAAIALLGDDLIVQESSGVLKSASTARRPSRPNGSRWPAYTKAIPSEWQPLARIKDGE